MDSQICLKVVKVNAFGSIQYVECDPSHAADPDKFFRDLDPKGYWSIKAPSDRLKAAASVVYTCSSGTFVLSEKLVEVVKPEGFGQGISVMIRSCDEDGRTWFIMVADNKHYLQNVSGGADIGESPEDAAKREVMEELGVDLKEWDFVEIAKWSYMGGSDLVDCHWPCITTAFLTNIPWTTVKYLFTTTDGVYTLNPNSLNVVNTKSLPFTVDETEQIFAFTEDYMVQIPESFPEYQKTKGRVTVPLEFNKAGHHRQLCELFNTDAPVIVPRFLSSFDYFKRGDEATKEWVKRNSVLLID